MWVPRPVDTGSCGTGSWSQRKREDKVQEKNLRSSVQPCDLFPSAPSHSLRLGGSFSRGDLSQMDQSVGRLRSMHSKALMDVETLG